MPFFSLTILVLACPTAPQAPISLFDGISLAGWNNYVIRCEGPRTSLWLNDVATINYTEKDPEIPRSGRIAFQLHSGGPIQVSFRDIHLLPPQEPSIAGVWKGNIEIPGSDGLGMVVVLQNDGQGGYTGTIDTPLQNIWGLTLSDISFADGKASMTVPLTRGRWEAELSSDGQTLSGTWHQNGAKLPMSCTKQPDAPSIPKESATNMLGRWEGKFAVGAVVLRIVFNFEQDEDGHLVGNSESPDQGPGKMPVTRIDWLGDRKMRISIGSIAGAFEAELSDDGKKLTGILHQGGTSIDLEIIKVEKATEVRRPQTPKPPFPYTEEEVSYRNEAGEVDLAGTLTLPPGQGPHPAVLLITGSGGQNRNEEIFQHKPFWVIADHFSRTGIAVLRVDDRGVGGTSLGPNPGMATSADFAGDVLAGVNYLKSRTDIDSKAIGLAGHSEGGMIAPMVAADSRDVAFIILIAGTGIPGSEILFQQSVLIARASGSSEEELESIKTHQRPLMDLLLDKSLQGAELEEKLTAALEANPFFSKDPDEREKELKATLAQLRSPWIRFFARHDPANVLERVDCPVLALNGEKDLQVPCEVNLAAIGEALKKGGNKNVTIHAFPDLNHLFQHCKTGLMEEYGKIEETFSPEVLKIMSSWIHEILPRK